MSDTPVTEIVGFDLGHGETAVAKVSPETDAEPEMLELFGKKSQITAIGRHPSKGVVIGERALILPGMTRFDICFKQRPTHDPLYRENIRQFLAECYKHLVEQGQIGGGESVRFFIGCPSGWPDEVMAEYGKLLSTSGIPSLSVVRESRAALLHTKEGGKLTLGELERSVLIIDLGSSTTDFTLVRGSSEQPLDFGDDLGAALIEQAILARTFEAHEKAAELKEVFATHPLHRARCEMQCRRAKEAYFAAEDMYADPDSRTQTGFEQIQDLCIFEPIVNGPIMQEVLNQPLPELGHRSWIQRFGDLVAEAKQRLDGQGITPSVLLLTGGASRMGFVQGVCTSTFPESDFRRDSEPERCIARGLSRWGRVDLRTVGFKQEVSALLESLHELFGDRVSRLKSSLGNCLADGLTEKVVKTGLHDWRSGAVPTLEALETHMKDLAEQWRESSEAKQDIAKHCAEWFEPIQQELSSRTNEICQTFRIPVGTMALDVSLDTAIEDMKVTDLTGPNPTTGITNVVAAIAALVIASLLGGGGTALLMSGPIGWIMGLLIGVVAGKYGGDKAKQWLREVDMPVLARKAVLTDGQIERQCAEMRHKLWRDVRQQLDNMPERFDQLTLDLKKQVGRLLDAKADEARLFIT